MADEYKNDVYKAGVGHSNMDEHLAGIKAQYDEQEKLDFYAQVMGDGTDNIHFGKWDNIDLDAAGAYGKASEQMTDYMFKKASDMVSDPISKYIDLGSGTGAAAIRIASNNPTVTVNALNLCDKQNQIAKDNAIAAGIAERMTVTTGTYESIPGDESIYDMAFSQDAFVHAFSKVGTYKEALRVVKPGGCLIFCDLMCGVSDDPQELLTFAQTNMVKDWLSPEKNVEAVKAAGWTDVEFIDLTADIKLSFQLMHKKVRSIIEAGNPTGIDMKLLTAYDTNLENRVGQVDKGVFKWGVTVAKKAQ